MRRFLATSNHGNQSDFNRKWKVEEIHTEGNPLINIALSVSDNHILINDDYFKEYPEALEEGKLPKWYEGEGVYDDNSHLEVKESDTSYNHDLVTYLIITYNAIDMYQYSAGTYFGLYSKLCQAAGEPEKD